MTVAKVAVPRNTALIAALKQLRVLLPNGAERIMGPYIKAVVGQIQQEQERNPPYDPFDFLGLEYMRKLPSEVSVGVCVYVCILIICIHDTCTWKREKRGSIDSIVCNTLNRLGGGGVGSAKVGSMHND
jgi:hypothetical protein